MGTVYCLRCRTVVLEQAGRSPAEGRFFECPACRRPYALHAGGRLTFRWLHPIALMLYPVMFEAEPATRAASVAARAGKEQTPEQLQETAREIRLELAEPTQQVRDILDCRASEEQLRGYLRALADHLERALSGER